MPPLPRLTLSAFALLPIVAFVADPPPRQEPARVEWPGLHNVRRLTDRLYTGGSPEGDAGFVSLRKLGVRTCITVDGARPEVERARKHGIRYVHLPIGYDGVPRAQALRIARAVRDLPGAIYLHCHHGKHRAPAAAALVRLCLDERCTVETALAEMRRAGTDPRYVGLYAAPKTWRRPTKDELDRVVADFPAVSKIAALAQRMVAVDGHWDHLQAVRAAGWKTPPNHPDVDPAHEALLLAEQYRESARLPEATKRPEDFRRRLAAAEADALALEAILRRGKQTRTVVGSAAEKAYQRIAAACVQCHARHRDVPQGR